ncbi:MAG: GGDEF domain-containing protein [Thermoleophilia bacterium]
MEVSILPDNRDVLKEIPPPPGEFDVPAELVDALTESDSARARGAMDFYWTSLAPFTLLVIFGLSILLFVVVFYRFDAGLSDLLVPSGLVLAVGLLVLLPLEYHLVRVRILRPIERLESELLGRLPWRPDQDTLLASLRHSVVEIRLALRSMDRDLRLQRERGDDLQARLNERAAADAFADRVAEALRGAESVKQFADEAARLIGSVWPVEDFLLLYREEGQSELSVLVWEHAGAPVELGLAPGGLPRYPRASLPVPVKEALRRGFYSEAGLPFSQDPAFPEARSFLAMALEHRGGDAGVMLALTSRTDPPSAEPLRRSRPLFSVGFGRAMYLRELGEAEIRDALTGAFTYDHFLTVVRHEIARANRYSRSVACVTIDVDNLRRVNSEHGSAVGDRVIMEVAQVAAGAIRSCDTLARVAGARLSLLLPETDLAASEVVAERVRSRVEEHPFIVASGQVERVTVSLGIAVHPPFGVTAISLVDAAERALADAKRGGRNRVTVAADGERSWSGEG